MSDHAELRLLRKEKLKELRRIRRSCLFRYIPYPKQYEFHKAGCSSRERLLLAGSQNGKTFPISREGAMHTTGWYPDWWTGRRFDRPIVMWTGAATNAKSREVIQKALLGCEETDLRHPDMGTGAIPGDAIKKISKRQAGIDNVADQIRVRHVSGGTSIISLKTYDQDVATFVGTKVDVWWSDEEAPMKIYSEGVTRTQAVADGICMATFTPMKGMSNVLKRFLSPEPGDPPRHVTNMTLHDAIGGIYPQGTPWAGMEWKGHYTKEQVEERIANYPEHERDARAYGIPMMGEGLIYTVSEKVIKCEPFEIPKHFARIAGCDFGFSHAAAGVWIAHDRDTDTVYVYDCFREPEKTYSYLALSFKSRSEWIPIAWPHDGLKRGAADGPTFKDQYKHAGARMMKQSARYDDDHGGGQSTEPVVQDNLERMMTGRFKVFSHLDTWFEEFRMYHRENTKIVRAMDDLMSATNYAMMELRHARTEPVFHVKQSKYQSAVIA